MIQNVFINNVALLLAITYLLFFFISNMLNPFTFSGPPFRKRQFQLGRAASLISLASGACALILLHGFGFSERLAVALYLCLSALLIIPSIIKFRRRSLWR